MILPLSGVVGSRCLGTEWSYLCQKTEGLTGTLVRTPLTAIKLRCHLGTSFKMLLQVKLGCDLGHKSLFIIVTAQKCFRKTEGKRDRLFDEEDENDAGYLR